MKIKSYNEIDVFISEEEYLTNYKSKKRSRESYIDQIQ